MQCLHTCSNDREPISQVIYDIMVCAVGETTATFGVPGVMEHCYFMKAGAHANNIPLSRSLTPWPHFQAVHAYAAAASFRPLEPCSERAALTRAGRARRR